jgi:hypothetical protein
MVSALFWFHGCEVIGASSARRGAEFALQADNANELLLHMSIMLG